MRWVILSGIGMGCVFTPSESDCEDIAITNADGEVDACDLQACEACADACGEPCAVLESYPPQYACEDGSTFTASDECPDWEPPAP